MFFIAGLLRDFTMLIYITEICTEVIIYSIFQIYLTIEYLAIGTILGNTLWETLL